MFLCFVLYYVVYRYWRLCYLYRCTDWFLCRKDNQKYLQCYYMPLFFYQDVGNLK